MQWHFVDMNCLEEAQSGYQIHLISGTWFHPGQLKPLAPDDLDFPQQLKLLRAGLDYIRSIGKTRINTPDEVKTA